MQLVIADGELVNDMCIGEGYLLAEHDGESNKRGSMTAGYTIQQEFTLV
jgi:hypothetical protein